MGRTEARSGQAAKRPMAATSGASLPRDVSVFSIVADLEGRVRSFANSIMGRTGRPNRLDEATVVAMEAAFNDRGEPKTQEHANDQIDELIRILRERAGATGVLSPAAALHRDLRLHGRGRGSADER